MRSRIEVSRLVPATITAKLSGKRPSDYGRLISLSTMMVKLCVERSTPPSAVPPLSRAFTVMAALPVRPWRGSKVSVLLELSSGCTWKRSGLVLSMIARETSDPIRSVRR